MPLGGKLRMLWIFIFIFLKQASHNETVNGSYHTLHDCQKKLKSTDNNSLKKKVQIYYRSKLEHCIRSGTLKYLTCFKEFISTAFQFESRLDFHYIWCSECRRSIQSIFSGPWKYFTINIPLNKEFSSRMPKV